MVGQKRNEKFECTPIVQAGILGFVVYFSEGVGGGAVCAKRASSNYFDGVFHSYLSVKISRSHYTGSGCKEAI